MPSIATAFSLACMVCGFGVEGSCKILAGLPSQSLMWGPWKVGMAATDPKIQARFQKAGLSMLGPQRGIQLLSSAMASMSQHCTPVLAEIDWPKLLSTSQKVPSLFAEMVDAESKVGPGKKVDSDQARLPVSNFEAIQEKVSAVVASMLGGRVPIDQVGFEVWR